MFNGKRKLFSCILSALMLFVLTACGGSAEDGKYYVSETSNVYYASKDSGYAQIGFEADSPQAAEAGDYSAPRVSSSYAAGDAATMAEKIIYTANMNIETTEFDRCVQAIESMLSAYDGFIAASEIRGTTQYNSDGSTSIVNRYGYFTLRIPSNRYHDFLHEAGELGNVTSKREGADNITAQFRDREARKLSLETQEKRLLELLAKAEEINDIIALESRLSDVRYEIESIESQLRNWQSQVDYSTVNINLTEVARYTPTVPVQRSFGERFKDAVQGSWADFVDGSQDFLIWFVYALPALIILAAIAVVVVLIVRKLVRKHAAHDGVEAAERRAAEKAEKAAEKAAKKGE